MLFKRNRTPTKHIYYALHLYFSGLSLRKVSQHLSPFIKRNLVSIWNWIQHYNKPEKMFHRKRKIYEFIVDETLIKVANELVWVWIAIELKDKTILGIPISYDERRSMLIAEQFMRSLVRKYGKHPVSTDSSGTWYPQACKFLKLIKHHIHLPYEKSIPIC
ncbi:MAG TPA: DDE-type integrase/transposase/recombinase [Nitrososphaeraceae archaeon]|nr:DDE-type integrase/transposase/recombinase [Nitrososphaeraceae archaeon]